MNYYQLYKANDNAYDVETTLLRPIKYHLIQWYTHCGALAQPPIRSENPQSVLHWLHYTMIILHINVYLQTDSHAPTYKVEEISGVGLA